MEGGPNACGIGSLWALLKHLSRSHWPVFIRGDRDWGTEGNLQRAEQEGLPCLFKLHMTAGVKASITSLQQESLTLAPWYRDRADAEHPFG